MANVSPMTEVPIEDALAFGIRSLGEALGRARPKDLVQLVERMATLARELEARRLARLNVASLASVRRQRSET